MSAIETETTFEFRLLEIPKKKMRTDPDPERLVEQLNELGAEGWQVVATFQQQYGHTNQLLLQRRR